MAALFLQKLSLQGKDSAGWWTRRACWCAFSGRLCRFVVQWLAVAGSAGVLRLSQFQSSVSSSLTMITWLFSSINNRVYTFHIVTFTFIVDTFVCLAYFTLLEQKRKQPLGGIESNLRKLFIFLLSLLTLLFVFTAKSFNRDDGQIIGFLKWVA